MITRDPLHGTHDHGRKKKKKKKLATRYNGTHIIINGTLKFERTLIIY